jgi:hopanoid biosynthesis associated protein HpnK
LIVTGDDFGRSYAVNEAIEAAHVRGILTTASLMVGEAAAGDAVARARRRPALRVGLHLTVVDGRCVLDPSRIPELAGPDGRFRENLVRAGFSYFFRPAVRRQLQHEIRAQFEAFRRTGLALDHVNAHHHLHLHPTVLGLILAVGRDYGLNAVRLPCEPLGAVWRAQREGRFGRLGLALMIKPWTALIRRRLGRRGIGYNDYLFGMHEAGRLSPHRVRDIIAALPEGVSEIHFHPAAAQSEPRQEEGENKGGSPEEKDQELLALTSPEIIAALKEARIEIIGFDQINTEDKNEPILSGHPA